MRPITIKDCILLGFAAAGYSYKQMCPELGENTQTVKNRAHKLMQKLGAETIAHAVAIGIRQGLIN